MVRNLKILKTENCKSVNDFINHWKPLYNYFDEERYDRNIDVLEFSNENLIDLYHWKNGMTLKGSGGKEKSLEEKIIKRIQLINSYKKESQVDLKQFNRDFSDVSAVWRIFLLHIIKPKEYPIYDQHIHRAYNFIHDLEWQKITNTISDKAKLEFYFNTYLQFVNELDYSNLKELDEAFFAFGQFLNTRKQSSLLHSE